MDYLVDPWLWTIQYLEIATAKFKPNLVPPCDHLPKTVHKVPPRNDGAWSEAAKQRQSTRMKSKGTTVENHGRTALKYLTRILELRTLNPDWSQKQLGDAVGISQPAVSNLLKAHHAST